MITDEIGGGGGGAGISGSALANLLTGYATQDWVGENYISIEFFSRLFQAHGTENGVQTDIDPNDMDSTITSIESMFGFWTDYYLSALGNGGGLGSTLYLSTLADVLISSPANNQVLTYNATTGKWVNANAQAGAADLANLTDVTLTSLANEQFLKYDSSTQKWINTAMKTINGQSLIGSGDISVGGGASGNYLPLTGGTLTGNLQIYAESGNWSEGIRMHVAQNGWCALVLAGSDNTGSTGTSARTWNLSNNNGDLYLALNGATTYTYGWSWLMSGDLSFKTSAFTINCSDNALSLNSATANSWIFFKSNGTNKGSVAYYEGMAAIANETNAYRIGVIDNGTPVFRKGGYSGSATYKLLHGGESIELWATGSSFNEGLRMHPSSNSWVGVTLCGVENTGDSGTSANTWCIANHNGQIFINRNGADGASEYVLCNPNGNWGIATNSPSYKLHVDGTIYATGNVTALSDARKKDVLGDKAIGVEQIADAPAVQFLWKGERAKEGVQVGTLAQYWQGVLPEVVLDKGGELSMQYGVAALVSAIITARKVVDHERRISELERENERLKTEVKQLR